jgi:hypothetical protein
MPELLLFVGKILKKKSVQGLQMAEKTKPARTV